MLHLCGSTPVILAGGMGTRLRRVVADRPKPLALVAGKPFITYLLEQLLLAGFKKAVIASGYLGGQFREHFGECYQTLKLHYSQEPMPLGTGGALRYALPHVTTSRLLVLNGDSFCDINFHAFLEFHLQKQARITLAAVKVPDVGRYGSIEMSPHGEITHFVEKGAHVGAGYINAGVYLLERSVIEVLDPNAAFSLERDVLCTHNNGTMFSFKTNGAFIDIGIPEDYERAQQLFGHNRGGMENH